MKKKKIVIKASLIENSNSENKTKIKDIKNKNVIFKKKSLFKKKTNKKVKNLLLLEKKFLVVNEYPKKITSSSTNLEKILLEKKFLVTNDHLKKKTTTASPNLKKFLLEKKFLVINKQPKKIEDTSVPNLKGVENKLNNIFNFNLQSQKYLQVKNVSKTLGGRPILKNISLNIPPGKISGLIGPNGSGKTTLFSTIIGKIYPDTGKIIFNNEEIQNIPIHERSQKGISLLEQTKGLFSNMTVEDNLYSILELHIKNKEDIAKKIDRLLMYFNLNYLKNIKASKLSGGETKKIAILQRICNPVVNTLLLDEPCAALDPLSISTLKSFIFELNQIGLTILIVEHNYWAIQDLCSQIYLIKDGEILVEGPPAKISNDKDAIKYYLGSNFKV